MSNLFYLHACTYNLMRERKIYLIYKLLTDWQMQYKDFTFSIYEV